MEYPKRYMYPINLPQEGDKTYVVRDLYLAAALLTMKFPVLEINVQLEGMKNIPIGYFTFETTPELTKAVNMYLNKEMRLEPIEYFGNVRQLKSQAISAGKNPFANLVEHPNSAYPT